MNTRGASIHVPTMSFEIGASFAPIINSGLSNPTFSEGQVFACLRAYAQLIENAEDRFRVTRLAIAGAIAWEILCNSRPSGWRAVGLGKVHAFNIQLNPYDTAASQAEERGYLPKRTSSEREALLATPAGAIDYIAAIMLGFAEIAAQYGFPDIRNDEVILTNAYQGRDLKGWEAHLKKKRANSSFEGGNEMDLWVSEHRSFLVAAVGSSKLN